jgi:uncharacterized protein YcbK (DUF882 family)
LSPTELAAAFPDYYRRASPDVSGFISAQTKKREGRSGVEPSATAAPSTRLPSRASAPGNYTTSAESAVRNESRKGLQPTSTWQDRVRERTGVSIGDAGSGGPAMDRLKAEISRGEGNYDSVNRGTAGDTRGGATRLLGRPLSDFTVGEIMEMQKGPRGVRKLFAVGKYQFIPETLAGAVRYTGVDLNAKFDAATQEKLFPYTISSAKNRHALQAYLDGRSNDFEAAMRDLSQEYASIPMANGRGYHDRDRAGNMAHGGTERVARIKRILDDIREERAAARQNSDSTRQGENLPQLPQGISPQLLEEYNRMTPRQKANFQSALGKLDQDPAAAVEKMNQIFQQNPAVVDRAAAQGTSFNYTNVAFSSDRIRSGVSQLSQETQSTLQRLDSFGVPVTVTSTFRSPEQNARTPGAARTSMHMSGNAVDVRTNGKSPEELQRTVQALKRAGFNKVLIENDHIHAEVHPGSDNFSVSLRKGHSNRNISLDQAREAAGAVAFREPVQQQAQPQGQVQADDINAPERRRKEVQTDRPRQESTAQPVQRSDINRPETVRAEQQGQTVFVGGDSIGQGVATASRATNLAASGRRFTSDAMFNQLTRVPKGGTFHMYAGTNDAASGVVDPEAYDRQMARMAQFAKENNINLKIYGPHKSNKDWDERFGNTVDRNMADAAARYGIPYTSNRSVAANAGDGVHFDGDAYAALAMRNNIIPAMADGGSIEGVEDASKLTAIPMKSGRDDMLLMNQGEPVAKVNSEEKLTYDNERNRVTVTPKDRANADDLTAKMEERQQEIKDAPVLNQPQLAPNKPIEQVAPYTPERDFVNPVVPTDAALNDSMRRVMSRNEFKEEGSHFSFGASNFSA